MSLAQELDLNSRYARHGTTLVRALRREGKLKGLYCKEFPEAASYFDSLFKKRESSKRASAHDEPQYNTTPLLNAEELHHAEKRARATPPSEWIGAKPHV